MNSARFIRLSVIAFWMMANVAIAGSWIEPFDAGSLPTQPQVLSGPGELSAIHGTISGLDVDLFRIYLPDPAHTFSAIQSVPAGGDQNLGPQLFLFNDSGLGLVSTAGSALGLYPSARLASELPGYYWLGVAPSNIDPYTTKVHLFPGWSLANYPIFTECNSSPCAPTPQGEKFSLGGWGGTYHGIESPYIIQLTGAYFSDAVAAVPEPSMLLMIGAGLFALVAIRSRPAPTRAPSPLM